MGVYIWNASTGAISQLTELDSNEQDEYVTSLSWIKEGNILAVANSLGAVQVNMRKIFFNLLYDIYNRLLLS